MTVKEASKKFGLKESEIQKRFREGMIIGAKKPKRLIIIPDDTTIIPSKKDIKNFLIEIIKYKNNSNIVMSRYMCPTSQELCVIIKYLYQKGYIGKYDTSLSESKLLNCIQLTDNGLALLLGKNIFSYNDISVYINIPEINIAKIQTA